jgi:hypothetical protein
MADQTPRAGAGKIRATGAPKSRGAEASTTPSPLDPNEDEALKLLHDLAQESKHRVQGPPVKSRSSNRYV